MKSFCKSVVMLFMLCAIFSSELAGQLTSGTRDRVFHSTVNIYLRKHICFETDKGIYDQVFEWAGSGNVLSPDGWILTNAHVAFFDPSFVDPSYAEYILPYDWYIPDQCFILYTSNPELPPQALCLATVYTGDYLYLQPDIALLKCEYYLDGTEIPSDEDIFPDIHRLGDSDELEHGDEVYCVGYPDYAEGAISYTSGEITNMLSQEDRFGEIERYYIGTDAAISGGNSGGAAVNEDGKLIGLPTMGLPGTGGSRYYITPINQAKWMLGTWVEESELGASVNGRIVSEQTGEGIIGADMYILYPGVSVEDFVALWQSDPLTEEDIAVLNNCIFGSCISGIEGRFRLDHLLPSGYEYSVIIVANNYEAMTAQNWLDINNANDRDITLKLVRY